MCLKIAARRIISWSTEGIFLCDYLLSAQCELYKLYCNSSLDWQLLGLCVGVASVGRVNIDTWLFQVNLIKCMQDRARYWSSAYLHLPRSLLLLLFHQVDFFLTRQKFTQRQKVHYMKQICLSLFVMGMSGWGNPIWQQWTDTNDNATVSLPGQVHHLSLAWLDQLGKTLTWKSHYLLTLMLIESRWKFRSAQDISGASQQNSATVFS